GGAGGAWGWGPVGGAWFNGGPTANAGRGSEMSTSRGPNGDATNFLPRAGCAGSCWGMPAKERAWSSNKVRVNKTRTRRGTNFFIEYLTGILSSRPVQMVFEGFRRSVDRVQRFGVPPAMVRDCLKLLPL